MPPDVRYLRLDELAASAGATLDGDGSTLIARVATLENAGAGTIAFLANPRYRPQLAQTRASAVIVAPDAAGLTQLPKLVSRNPYAVYAKVARILAGDARAAPGVHPTALVDADASIAASAAIGAFATIAAGAVIGDNVIIGERVSIGAGATIGGDSQVYANVVVYAYSVIGVRAIVHAGAVIGADGFGMAEENGRWLKIPQMGRVVIGADVEIGANTTIDRGAIDDTIIGDDVKIDNQVQIGHNCVIGNHTAIAGCVGIAGSAHIGRNCQIGGAAMIAGHLSIADGAVISGGTLVFHSIDAPGVYTSAFPTMPHAQWKHVASQTRNLRELAERVRALERAQHARVDDGTRNDKHNERNDVG
ncbi:MAG: UDP-3-O-(3-hydroxymyristoyl)glucosamine N-acyltransferase [Casimicrobiaceae bacterium]